MQRASWGSATTGGFPDLFLWRLAGLSTAGMMAATIAAVAAIGVAAMARTVLADIRSRYSSIS